MIFAPVTTGTSLNIGYLRWKTRSYDPKLRNHLLTVNLLTVRLLMQSKYPGNLS
jgi:hypothetical protein